MDIKINLEHLKKQGRKFSELCHRLYACDSLTLEHNDRTLLLKVDVDIASLIGEITRIKELFDAVENDLYNANMNLNVMTNLCKEYQWIPTAKLLPQSGETVLAAFDDGFIATVTFEKDWELWADAGEVTHWMKLPKGPGVI